MTTNLAPELQTQIEQEAAKLYPLIGHVKKKIGYETGAKKYAEKWQEAEARADRYEKALKEIYGHAGFVPHKHEMITIAREALTPKTSIDDTANG